MTKYYFLTNSERFIFQLFQNNLITLQQLVSTNIGNYLLNDFYLNYGDPLHPNHNNYINKLKMCIRYMLDLTIHGEYILSIHNKFDLFKHSGTLDSVDTDLFVEIRRHSYLRDVYAYCIFNSLDYMNGKLIDSRTVTDKGNSTTERYTIFTFKNISSSHKLTLLDSLHKEDAKNMIDSITL